MKLESTAGDAETVAPYTDLMQGETDNLWQRLIDHWRRGNVVVPPGAGEEAITRFEAEQGIQLPEDLKSYFRAAGGTGDDMDPDYYRFWPLKEVGRSVAYIRDSMSPAEPGVKRSVFCDFCIDCWAYLVEVDPGASEAGPVYKILGEPPGEVMAETFRGFFEKYLADPDSVI